jgi:tetratricopeptide (TPR) repeat protein
MSASMKPCPKIRLVAAAAVLAGALAGCSGSGSTYRGTDTTVSAAERGNAMVASAEDAIRRGDTERALAELARAIEVNPTLTKAHMDMGDIYRTSGDYSSAEVSYGRAAQSEPRNFDAQYYHGMMLQLLDRVTEAIGAYLRALSIRPSDFDANLKVSTAYYQLDENKLALEYAKHAVEIRPRDGAARLNLGAVYAALEDHNAAVREYQQAAELMPLNSLLLLNMAQSLGRLERYTEMRNTLEQLIKIEPSAAAHERLGFAVFKLGDPERSAKEFQNALRYDAEYYPALNGLGVCYLNKYLLSDQQDNGSRTEAITCFRRSLQINPDQPRVMELLSRYGR